jgi:desulfoferrodoxin (superoxide reductase-like protein)
VLKTFKLRNHACNHWLELMYDREKISETEFSSISKKAVTLQVKLNNFISSTSKQARDHD